MFESHPHPRPFADRWFADPAPFLRARWLFLRALGAIFAAAFGALWFQIHGLIGPNGILPARDFLQYAKGALGAKAYWLIPSLLWVDAGRVALTVLVVAGLAASVAIVCNLWPRVAIGVALVAFLSFVTATREFSAYQSDSMLLEAAFLALFLAPCGVRPGVGAHDPPTRAAVFLLQWLWFRIYFESGLVKFLSGEEQWRNLTAMDRYYENGPLPTWIAWYVQKLPHGFHAATVVATLLVELVVVWLVFAPRRARIAAFCITAPLQLGIILTANYAFLNYLVLALGVMLLEEPLTRPSATLSPRSGARGLRIVVLPLVFVLSIVILFTSFDPLGQFRIVNNYGLFAVMTRERYEIEFQGTQDGKTWIAYPFRFKPQDPRRAPRIYAPYQPRFDWNLWFASFGSVSENAWVVNVQQRLLQNEPDVLRLFAGNPFAGAPPRAVRAVRWQYWFTTYKERARTGNWWNRRFAGEYSALQMR